MDNLDEAIYLNETNYEALVEKAKILEFLGKNDSNYNLESNIQEAYALYSEAFIINPYYI